MKTIMTGKAFVIGDNIDTDQIIPAEFLSYNPAIAEERRFFGKHALCGVPTAASGLPRGNIPFVAKDQFASEFAIVIGGRNFGCGSSREHAPLALAEAGVQAVVAESYARIFYRNSINGAYIVPVEAAERLVDNIATGDQVEIDLAKGTLKNVTSGKIFKLNPLGDVQAIIEAGGIFQYAKQSGLLK